MRGGAQRAHAQRGGCRHAARDRGHRYRGRHAPMECPPPRSGLRRRVLRRRDVPSPGDVELGNADATVPRESPGTPCRQPRHLFSRRGLAAWTRRARSSLPVPRSPRMRMGRGILASSRACSTASRKAGLRPIPATASTSRSWSAAIRGPIVSVDPASVAGPFVVRASGRRRSPPTVAAGIGLESSSRYQGERPRERGSDRRGPSVACRRGRPPRRRSALLSREARP